MSKLIARIPALAKAGVEAATPKLNTFVHYAKVELVPPTPGELGGVAAGLGNILKSAQSGAWKNLTVKEATLDTLVAAEVLCWFFIGECIGKGSVVGYQV
uniref:ATP synthase subunit g n=1 Tax=Palaemon varians TaxID=647170 RepID=D7F2K3_PALVA|nr:ATP synthase subunit g [Palaemon varians]